MRSTSTLLAVIGLLSALLLAAPTLGFNASEYSQPRADFSATDTISVQDTVVYQTAYISENGSEWTPINLTGPTTVRNWILGGASSDADLTGIRYVAAYSCTWNNAWSCSETWQIRDRGEQQEPTPEPVCGNDIIEQGEQCEPGNVPTTCQQQGYDNGSISCTDSCELDTSSCTMNPPPEGSQYLVQDGQPLADIVVASDAPNTVQTAAELLSEYINDMSGATLAINNAPDDSYDFHVYVGASQHTDSLGVSADGTRDGGFKMVSGDDYLVLLGDDEPLDNSKYMSLNEWDSLTAPDIWHNPNIDSREHNGKYDIWEQDGRGSINAVHEFLRGQGMRWYHPDSWGTITPDKQDVSFEALNRIQNPDFALRDFAMYFIRFGHNREGIYGPDYEFGSADDHMHWMLSLGTNAKEQYIDGVFPHGLNAVTSREETRQEHPEYYAVWDGNRMDGLEEGEEYKQNLCSEELLEATIRYAKTMYDEFDAQYVSVWPQDGFVRVSEHSQECRDMATPERGRDGQISNYVWDFINEVAWAIHDDPNYSDDRMIVGGAYSAYQLPPTELSDPRGMAPNIAVWFTRWRTWSADPEEKQHYQSLIDQWAEMLPSNQVFSYDYYLHNRPGRTTESIPYFYPQLITEDLRFLHGRSGGEFVEISSNWPGDDLEYDSFAAESFNTWLTARLYWDVDQDVNALLEEYYDLYYGPAADTMQQLVEYSEENIPQLASNTEHMNEMRQLAQDARSQVPSGSDYEKRIDNLIGLMNHNYVGDEVILESCQDLTSAGTTYKLGQDVSAQGTCFFIDQNGITLDCQGHTITYSTGGGSDTHGVHVYGRLTGRGHYTTVKNCHIQDGSSGTGSGNAISIGYPDYVTIQNNTINTSGHGISLSRSTNSTVKGNTVYAGEEALGMFNGNSDEVTSISSHTIEDNYLRSESRAAYLYRITDDVIRDNTFSGGNDNGLRMFYPVRTVLENNVISSDSATALYMYGDEDVQQSGNTVTDG